MCKLLLFTQLNRIYSQINCLLCQILYFKYTSSVRCSPNQHIRNVGIQTVITPLINFMEPVDPLPCKKYYTV